jgi:hypothetical protein
MQGQKQANHVRNGLTSLLVVGTVAIALVVFSGVAEASWSHIEGKSEILAASSSPVSTIITQAVGRSVSLLMMAVAIIIAVPLVIACLALSVSYIVTQIGRHTHRKVDTIPGTKLSKKLTGYQVPG